MGEFFQYSGWTDCFLTIVPFANYPARTHFFGAN